MSSETLCSSSNTIESPTGSFVTCDTPFTSSHTTENNLTGDTFEAANGQPVPGWIYRRLLRYISTHGQYTTGSGPVEFMMDLQRDFGISVDEITLRYCWASYSRYPDAARLMFRYMPLHLMTPPDFDIERVTVEALSRYVMGYDPDPILQAYHQFPLVPPPEHLIEEELRKLNPNLFPVQSTGLPSEDLSPETDDVEFACNHYVPVVRSPEISDRQFPGHSPQGAPGSTEPEEQHTNVRPFVFQTPETYPKISAVDHSNARGPRRRKTKRQRTTPTVGFTTPSDESPDRPRSPTEDGQDEPSVYPLSPLLRANRAIAPNPPNADLLATGPVSHKERIAALPQGQEGMIWACTHCASICKWKRHSRQHYRKKHPDLEFDAQLIFKS